MPKFQATAYLRLSYTENHENESDSIANQKKLIEDYLKEHPDMELVSEKVDDGYSGILFDRPAFQEMMQDIVEGKINCVIVKDLSRLGREYIETGRYLRRIFPAYGVRFIAINDNIDTAHEHAGDDLNISMKNLINDAYCHDISVKTQSALEVKRKKGDYVGACPVYGYRKSEENRNQLVVDEYAARVVRDIFRAKIDGRSAKRIADELNALGVLSPLAYKINRGLPHPKGGFADRPDAKWSATTVIRILQDEIYTGTLVQGRQGTYNHKLRNVIQKPDEEWIRVENAHEAIIRKRDFDLVQHIMGLDTRTAPEGEKVYLFSGLLVCGCCGARMTRKTNSVGGKKYIYYHCPTSKKHGCTHPVMLREDDLIQCVLTSMQAHIKNVVSVDELLNSISIENQKRALHSFVDQMEGIRNIEVLEFIDNGYSGTNFERPAIQKLLGQVQAGEVNCIIVKDFTRFGRNAIEVGYFMERVFPLYGVRFISVNDDFDSGRLHGDTGGLDVAFKYLVAEFYSRDLSVKSKSAKYVKMRRGEYQSKICPYGYRKGPNGRMEPDEETAPVVRLIFEMARDGHSTTQIARALLEKGIQTPGERKAAQGIVKHDVSRSGGIWQTSTLRNILTDERYTGTYIMGKRAVREVGGNLVRKKEESEWFKIPDHHTPIISKELFQQVQERFPRVACVKKQAHRYPLRGKVFCGVCSHAMSRTSNKNHAFYCRHSQADENAPCHGLHISEAELEGVLYEIMNKQAQVILNLQDLSDAEPLDVHLAKQADCLKQIDSCQDRKRILYEQMLLGAISTEDYKAKKAMVDKELGRLNRIYDALCKQMEQMRMGDESRAARKRLAQEVTGASGLTAALVDALIERVEVYPENQVRIIWKLKDFCMEA